MGSVRLKTVRELTDEIRNLRLFIAWVIDEGVSHADMEAAYPLIGKIPLCAETRDIARRMNAAGKEARGIGPKR